MVRGSLIAGQHRTARKVEQAVILLLAEPKDMGRKVVSIDLDGETHQVRPVRGGTTTRRGTLRADLPTSRSGRCL